MKITIGADHGGYRLKNTLADYLRNRGYGIIDVGTHDSQPCDYPDFARKVVKLIKNKKAAYGILICKSGLGMSMAANRKKGIRAALCHNLSMARTSRQHNNANVLALGANYTTADSARRIVDVFIKTEFLGGRHARRIKKIET